MKVIHIVESMDHGAVESWLVRMLQHAKKRNFNPDWTFYCTLGRTGKLDEQVRALGARVLQSPVPIGRKRAFLRSLRAELKQGRYDVLHAHHDLVSAIYLLAAMGLPVRMKIVHVHNADEETLTRSRLKKSLFRGLGRRICLAMADRVLGISSHTLETFLAGRPRRPSQHLVHYYGIDSSRFEHVSIDRVELRRQLGLSEDALIMLFAARLVPEKNPIFAVDVLAELRRLEPRAVAVFAGTGSLEDEILDRAQVLAVNSNVRVLGWRRDIPEIMMGCDWFILPHPERPMEGFGLAVVEAQLAGMRMLLSTGVADDPLLPTACVRRLPLADGPGIWAHAATELLREPAPSRPAALTALRDSPMDLDRALEGLLALHA